MLRYLITAAILTPLAFSQNSPAFQWIKQVDSSGSDSFAGLGVDAAGNTYIAGSTYASTFPVLSAAQDHLASAGLYKITGPGPAYTPLGLSSAYGLAVDVQNASTLYAISSDPAGGPSQVVKSANGGATFSALTFPSSSPFTLALDPSNSQIVYAGTMDQGLLKSTDGGATWKPSNGSLQGEEPGQLEVTNIWVDPAHPDVVLANDGDLVRSADGGATWQVILSHTDILKVTFDSAVPGLIYVSTNQGAVSVSTDDGQTFTSIKTPVPLGSVFADPGQSGHLLGVNDQGFYSSTDNGATWTAGAKSGVSINYVVTAVDWANGFLYAGSGYGVVEVTTDLKTVAHVGPPSIEFVSSMVLANGALYAAAGGSRDVYVTKLDPAGNIVYSTYFGGSGDDVARAVAVDRAGNVYVTGSTLSADFPVTKGAYASTGGSFVFKLNPQGAVVYSTYFQPTGNTPAAIAVDAAGAVYLAGSSSGGLVTTPGVYEPTCQYCGATSNGFFSVFTFSGYAAKLDAAGATLLYSTYVGQPVQLYGNLATSIAAAPDGTAYIAGMAGLIHLNPTGTAALAVPSPASPTFTPQTVAIAPDGTVYVAGAAMTFPTTPGAFQTSLTGPPLLPYQDNRVFPATVIVHYDAQLAKILAATFFGPGKSVNAMAFDPAGNLYLGGGTGEQALAARTPIQLAFARGTGFVSELSADLSTLLFSSYFGDTQQFSVQGLAVRPDGNVMLGGITGVVVSSNEGPYNVWVNSVVVAAPPALRVDSVVSAASLLDGPISAGETVIVQGAGFGGNPQLSIGGVIAQPISMTATSITAAVPQTVPAGAAEVQVSSGGASSNPVLVKVNATSPAVFSQDGSGFGQGYIFNKDGTLNTASNPAAPGDQITILATGVGPITITNGYAVTEYPVSVYVDDLYCQGIEAFLRPFPGLPGDVFEIQVHIPNPADLVSSNPDFKDFVYPPLVGLTMNVNGGSSQTGIAISIAQPQ